MACLCLSVQYGRRKAALKDHWCHLHVAWPHPVGHVDGQRVILA